jgi:hypothetical protein
LAPDRPKPSSDALDFLNAAQGNVPCVEILLRAACGKANVFSKFVRKVFLLLKLSRSLPHDAVQRG